MKKILSVLLASLLLLSTSATAFAMETETNADNWLVSANQHQIIHNAKIAAETGQNVTLTTKILSDLSDNHFELVEVGDTVYDFRPTIRQVFGRSIRFAFSIFGTFRKLILLWTP